jgi:hypothetical protein
MLNFKGSGTYAQIFIFFIPKPLNSFFCFLFYFYSKKRLANAILIFRWMNWNRAMTESGV